MVLSCPLLKLWILQSEMRLTRQHRHSSVTLGWSANQKVNKVVWNGCYLHAAPENPLVIACAGSRRRHLSLLRSSTVVSWSYKARHCCPRHPVYHALNALVLVYWSSQVEKPLTVTGWEVTCCVTLVRIWVKKPQLWRIHTQRPTQGAHITQSHICTKLNTKAPKPQQPVLQPKPKLNSIPAGTSIRAVEDKVGHRRRTGFTSKVSTQTTDCRNHISI